VRSEIIIRVLGLDGGKLICYIMLPHPSLKLSWRRLDAVFSRGTSKALAFLGYILLRTSRALPFFQSTRCTRSLPSGHPVVPPSIDLILLAPRLLWAFQFQRSPERTGSRPRQRSPSISSYPSESPVPLCEKATPVTPALSWCQDWAS